MLRDLSTLLPVTSIHPYFKDHGLPCRAHREEVDRRPDPCTSFYEISRLSREVKGPFCTNYLFCSLRPIYAFCVALRSPSVFGLLLRVTLVSSFFAGTNRGANRRIACGAL